MRKLIHVLVLFIGTIAVSNLTNLPAAPAQVKDKPKDSKDKTVPKEEHGAIEVYKDKAGEWRFKVTNADGKAIAIGTSGHEKKEDILKVIEQVKTTLNHAKVDVHEDKK